jgi:hypothetical protein
VLASKLSGFLKSCGDPRIRKSTPLYSELQRLLHHKSKLFIGGFRVGGHEVASFHYLVSMSGIL